MLSASISAGLTRWLAEQGVAQIAPTALSHLNLVFTDDVERAMRLHGDDGGCEEWWLEFGGDPSRQRVRLLSNNQETVEPPPVGAFAIRSGGDYETIALLPWINYIKSKVRGRLAGDVVGVIQQGIAYIGGRGPGWCWEHAWDYDYGGFEDEVENPITVERFETEVPAYARQWSYSIDRLRRSVKRIEKDASYHPELKKLLGAVLAMAEVDTRHGEWWKALCGGEPTHDRSAQRLNHRGYFYRCIPPVYLPWRGEDAIDDICVRIFDDDLHMIQADMYCDVCWLHGFDLEKQGGAETPGTLAHAIDALKRIIEALAPLDRLLTLLQEDPPNKPRPLMQVFAPRVDDVRVVRPVELRF